MKPKKTDVDNALLNASDKDELFAIDTDYRYLTFNENHKKSINRIWAIEITPDLNILNVIQKEYDRNIARQNFDRAFAGESYTQIEQHANAQGHRRYFESHYHPIKDSQGKVKGVTVFYKDISSLKKMEQDLFRAQEVLKLERAERNRIDAISGDMEARMRLITGQASSLFWKTDGEFKFTACMGTGLSQLNLEPESFIGLSIEEFFAKSPDLEQIKSMHWRALHGQTVKFEAKLRDYWYRISIEPLWHHDNRIAGCIGGAMDISENKTLKNQLIKAKEMAEAAAEVNTEHESSKTAAI